MTEPLTFRVYGKPAPQGSKRAIVNAGRARLVESSAAVRPWRDAVKLAAREAMGDTDTIRYPGGGISVTATFMLPRPAGHYRTGRNAHLLRDSAPSRPAGKPDLDKLLRASLDALSEAGVWRDDAQVTYAIASKIYAEDEPAGAVFSVGVMA